MRRETTGGEVGEWLCPLCNDKGYTRTKIRTLGDEPKKPILVYVKRGECPQLDRALELKALLLAACEAALKWHALDGDGISDPVKKQIKDAVEKAKGEQ